MQPSVSAPQLMDVFRGLLVTSGFGILAAFAAEQFHGFGEGTRYPALMQLLILFYGGAIVGFVVSVFVLLIWLVLAIRGSFVSWWVALCTSMLVAGVIGARTDDPLAILIMVVYGAALGLVFWGVTFGWGRRGYLALRR